MNPESLREFLAFTRSLPEAKGAQLVRNAIIGVLGARISPYGDESLRYGNFGPPDLSQDPNGGTVDSRALLDRFANATGAGPDGSANAVPPNTAPGGFTPGGRAGIQAPSPGFMGNGAPSYHALPASASDTAESTEAGRTRKGKWDDPIQRDIERRWGKLPPGMEFDDDFRGDLVPEMALKLRTTARKIFSDNSKYKNDREYGGVILFDTRNGKDPRNVRISPKIVEGPKCGKTRCHVDIDVSTFPRHPEHEVVIGTWHTHPTPPGVDPDLWVVGHSWDDKENIRKAKQDMVSFFVGSLVVEDRSGCIYFSDGSGSVRVASIPGYTCDF
jgi:hypothetical protein